MPCGVFLINEHFKPLVRECTVWSKFSPRRHCLTNYISLDDGACETQTGQVRMHRISFLYFFKTLIHWQNAQMERLWTHAKMESNLSELGASQEGSMLYWCCRPPIEKPADCSQGHNLRTAWPWAKCNRA